tara:strand:- start:728 stop:1012 length:285 start_codon:yes stop_codon:yes gene_type:complete
MALMDGITYDRQPPQAYDTTRYNVLLDGEVIGAVRKIRHRYAARKLRGNVAIFATRTEWRWAFGMEYDRVGYDTRAGATEQMLESLTRPERKAS